MKNQNPAPHWLDNSFPEYWKQRQTWRVRCTKKGRQFQWVVPSAKKDPSSTGKAIAYSEWQKQLAEIKAGEARAADPLKAAMAEAEKQDEGTIAVRLEFEESSVAKIISFRAYKDLRSYILICANHTAVEREIDSIMSGVPLTPAEKISAAARKPFSELLDFFISYLGQRLANTKPGLKKKGETLSMERHDEYVRCAEHMKKLVGDTQTDRVGEFHILEKPYSLILDAYKMSCEKEMTKGDGKKSWSGSWFNERMKTARMITSVLLKHRMLSALPPNIEELTSKYTLEPNPKEIPLDILKAMWKAADDEYKGYMLVALNLGFRQKEISSLEFKHIRKIGGEMCIVKKRGKTGADVAIPLWKSTLKFMMKGNKTGRLFTSSKGTPLHHGNTDTLYARMLTVRSKDKRFDEYSFENFRDTGAEFMDGVNPLLTALFLANGDKRQARSYVGGKKVDMKIPQNMAQALEAFRKYLTFA
jgi:integrase